MEQRAACYLGLSKERLDYAHSEMIILHQQSKEGTIQLKTCRLVAVIIGSMEVNSALHMDLEEKLKIADFTNVPLL